ncbi:MAG: hypothetical protein JW772_02515 [Candidatus Diapherotrites archaeon]|nr:hypothetical protein [Candidatus Diapherotrites archaeon]
MKIVVGHICYRCSLCNTLFFDPEDADRCCKRAKAQILMEQVRPNIAGIGSEEELNAIREHVLRKPSMFFR